MRILNEEQLDIFMKAILKEPMWHDFFFTEITTGLRLGEICRLKWSDLDENTGKLKIQRYDLSRTCDEIRPTYRHVETCQQTVPEAITAFLEGNDFEDVIRTAVSLGGDCDTLTCIAGGIAEAHYGIPDEMRKECLKRLPKDMAEVLLDFKKRRKST